MTRNRSNLLAMTLAALTIMSGFSQPANADAGTGKPDSKATSSNRAKQSKPDAMKVWDEGFLAMRAVHAARLAIFEGEAEQATELMHQAADSLNAAEKDEQAIKKDQKSDKNDKKAAADNGDWVAIDGSLALADTFVPSPEKARHVAKANEHFKKGDRDKGIEQLRLGEIEVNFSRVLMPLEATKKRVGHAIKLAKDHKYYEANLALKAAEDGLTIDTISLVDFPKKSNENQTAAKKGSNNGSAAKSDAAAKQKSAAASK